MPYAKRVGAMLVLASLAFALVRSAESPTSSGLDGGRNSADRQRPTVTSLGGSAVRASDEGPVEQGADINAAGGDPIPFDSEGSVRYRTGLARTTTRGRGTSKQHVSDAATRASEADGPLGVAELRFALPSSAPRALLVGRGSPPTVERNENDPELAIVEAAREFQQDPALMLCVARNESGLRANAIGLAGERGLMQFMPRTWGYYERLPDRAARWTGNAAALGYSEQDVWLPIPAARVAASMMARGQGWQWSTYRGCVR